MRMADLIENKKQGGFHEASEIRFIIQGCTTGEIPDYQLAAWLMAVWFRGLSSAETVTLTLAMADSGTQLDLSMIDGVKVDKHSTGGVADTTTLIVAPLVAAAGVKVAKMSGRGLGFTGGTIDKLESIPGFRTSLTAAQFTAQVQRVGMAVMGQTADLAPADGKLYALRDVTATVDSIPLIAASVMSKKIAAGADKILLDVKYGSGAFMKTVSDAQALARVMVDIGTGAGRETAAVISSMEEPLGTAIGNALEVAEAIDVLSGSGDARLTDFCVLLAAKLLRMAEPKLQLPEAMARSRNLLDSGAGLAKFQEFVAAQGGDARVVQERELLGSASRSLELRAEQKGYIVRMDSSDLGRAAILLGAGRAKKGDAIDLTAGIKLHRRCGDYVGGGDLLATLFFGETVEPAEAKRLIRKATHLAAEPQPVVALIAGTMDAAGW
ncbi:MAG: pyrimidine-nucleoside phosphorylase, partial [Firmicutes bacterium]|nr:pyrimidine-nucleoside phosphorylase [Bacillota bacterium]